MKKKYDAVATIGEYTDHTGQKKKRYTTVGTVFEGDDGRLSLKMDTVPVTPEWSGWVAFYDPKGRDEQPAPRQRQDAHNQAKSNAYQPQPEDQQDVPF